MEPLVPEFSLKKKKKEVKKMRKRRKKKEKKKKGLRRQDNEQAGAIRPWESLRKPPPF